MSSGKEKKDFKKREGKETQSTQGATCLSTLEVVNFPEAYGPRGHPGLRFCLNM